MSLADQLHQSKSIIFNGSQPGKIYFSENSILNLLAQELEAFEKNISLYKKLVDQKKNGVIANKELTFDEEVQELQVSDFWELDRKNKEVNKIFNTGWETSFITADIGW